MAYARPGHDSDVYIIGTYYNEERVIECCGCSFTPVTKKEPEDIAANGPAWARGLTWYAAPFPAFRDTAAVLAHLRKHAAAGDKVPRHAIERIERDDWLPPAHAHDDNGTVEGCPGCFWEPDDGR